MSIGTHRVVHVRNERPRPDSDRRSMCCPTSARSAAPRLAGWYRLNMAGVCSVGTMPISCPRCDRLGR
jgi:hypothetical protein